MKRVSGYFAFAAMAVNCLLIDMLSQFAKGIPESDGAEFNREGPIDWRRADEIKRVRERHYRFRLKFSSFQDVI